MRIVLGLFVVLGAPAIVGGFAEDFSNNVDLPPLHPINADGGNLQPDLPRADYDPYAGASLGNE